MDALAREFHDTHNMKVKDEIERLASESHKHGERCVECGTIILRLKPLWRELREDILTAQAEYARNQKTVGLPGLIGNAGVKNSSIVSHRLR